MTEETGKILVVLGVVLAVLLLLNLFALFGLVREIHAGVDFLREGAKRDTTFLRDGMSDEGKHIRESSKANTEYIIQDARSTANVTRSLR